MDRRTGSGSPALLVASAASGAIAVGIVLTTIAGVVRSWHPVPLGDTWDGFLRSWYRLPVDGVEELWAQHNEHRIVVGRLLAWSDLALSGGAGWPLMTLSLVLLAGATSILVWLLVRHVRDTISFRTLEPSLLLVVFAVIGTSWSWLSSENLLWTFQVPFFAVAMITLGSLGLVASAAHREEGRGRWVRVLAAVLLSLLAPWCIPAGLATPVIVALMIGLLGLGWRLAVVPAVAGLACGGLYSIGFVMPGFAGPSADTLRHPPEAIAFMLTFLGGPFKVAVGNTAIAVAAGVLFLGLSAAWIIRHLVNHHSLRMPRPFGVALAGYLTFTVVTAVVVSLGRADRGLDAAAPLRYQNLLVLAWACLIALWAPELVERLDRRPVMFSMVVLAVPLCLAAWQPWSFADTSSVTAARDRAVLAAALGVHDRDTLEPIYPNTSIIDDVLPRLRRDHLTIFGRAPYADLSSAIGRSIDSPQLTGSDCSYAIEASVAFPEDGLLRIEGTPSTPAPDHAGLSVLVDRGGTVVGYADLRPDSLLGYVSAAPNVPERAVIDGLACSLRWDPPAEG